MSILVEDSPRNLLGWIDSALLRGVAGGAVISPFATPRVGKPHRRDAASMVARVQQRAAACWFDSSTHALQLPHVGDFRYYDEYPLWGGARGDLRGRSEIRDHVERVFRIQDTLGVPHLAPTASVSAPYGTAAQLVVDMATEAMQIDANASITLAATPSFWSSGRNLDAFVGTLVQLAPAGWFLSVIRPSATLPVAATQDEVAGLCRTVHALSEDAPVHLSHGDLAGLPGIAAGATSLGSGWDQRQRLVGVPNFAARTQSEGGGWYRRPTLRGLLGSLKRTEAEVLERQDPGRAARLVPGRLPAPGAKEAFLHHLQTLTDLCDSVESAGVRRQRYGRLGSMYVAAAQEWPTVAQITRCAQSEGEWIAPHRDGLASYGSAEGW